MPVDRLARADAAPVARMATIDTQGHPHLVPITFAIDAETVFTMVDHKPKRTRQLRRLENLAANPRVCVLVDHYDNDWSKLWWVRIDGIGRVAYSGTDWKRGRELLAAKYDQYKEQAPEGPAIVITIEAVTDWSV